MSETTEQHAARVTDRAMRAVDDIDRAIAENAAAEKAYLAQQSQCRG